MRPRVTALEHMHPDPTSPWWGERRSRYHFAARYAVGRAVLDIACGTGYGCRILAEAGASFVLGIDIDVCAFALQEIEEETAYCAADGTRLPIASEAFDLIASFDTLEHVQDDEAFVAEIRRVLKPGGLVIVSAPNALDSRGEHHKPANWPPGRMYPPNQLEALFRRCFSRVELRGQRTNSYYPISPCWEGPAARMGGGAVRLKTLLWNLEDRLPFAVKDGMSRLIHNRSFYPGEFDFSFLMSDVMNGHVTLALCRP